MGILGNFFEFQNSNQFPNGFCQEQFDTA